MKNRKQTIFVPSIECGARDFINLWSMAGTSHHCTIGIGHKGATIEALASLLSIRAINI